MTVDRRIPRLERLEARLRPLPPAPVPLSGWERRELAQLEAEHLARFPGPVDTWTKDRCDDFIAYSAGYGGTAQRLAELRHRALTAQEQAELAANEIAIRSMSADELDLWMAEAARASQEEIHP